MELLDRINRNRSAPSRPADWPMSRIGRLRYLGGLPERAHVLQEVRQRLAREGGFTQCCCGLLQEALALNGYGLGTVRRKCGRGVEMSAA